MSYAKGVTFNHRKAAEKEIYFISNQRNEERFIAASFRVSGKVPQFYDAVSNQKIDVKQWKITNDRTTLKLALKPNESVFVIFEKPTAETQINKGNNWSNFKTIQDISKSWQAKFDTAYAGPSKPVVFNDLKDWTKNTDSLVKYYSGTTVYTKNFTFNGNTNDKILIDLGDFSCIAEVKINDISCGTLWTAPHRLEISKAIKKGDNVVVIAGDDKDLKKPRKVLEVVMEKGRVLVEGVNIVTKHTKPTAQNTKGGIVKTEAPIAISNVMLWDAKSGGPSKISRSREKGKLIRTAKKSGEVIK
ncbi:MAG: 50S ribosomal protein L24 [Chitinophagaceae bacterium]|nr:MAG: 50S ribosomal protein L24 [Chitinophagaceae bacterium]